QGRIEVLARGPGADHQRFAVVQTGLYDVVQPLLLVLPQLGVQGVDRVIQDHQLDTGALEVATDTQSHDARALLRGGDGGADVDLRRRPLGALLLEPTLRGVRRLQLGPPGVSEALLDRPEELLRLLLRLAHDDDGRLGVHAQAVHRVLDRHHGRLRVTRRDVHHQAVRVALGELTGQVVVDLALLQGLDPRTLVRVRLPAQVLLAELLERDVPAPLHLGAAVVLLLELLADLVHPAGELLVDATPLLVRLHRATGDAAGFLDAEALRDAGDDRLLGG